MLFQKNVIKEFLALLSEEQTEKSKDTKDIVIMKNNNNMKNLLILFSFLSFMSGIITAQDISSRQLEGLTNEKYRNDSILMELQIIRGLQQESKLKRDSIIEERKRRMGHPEEEAKDEMAGEYGAMLKIADNTRHDWIKDDWNVYGFLTFSLAVIAFIVSLWSYLYTKKTYFAQLKTEQHTTNAPIEVQLWKLKDLPRHFYRNLVCTCAIILKYHVEEKKMTSYPSEGNLMKLQTLPDDAVLPIDIDTDKEDNAYQHMHELKLLLRNYNVEIEVASNHLSRRGILKESLVQDFDNLLFKPLFLTRGTFDFKKALQKKSKIEKYELVLDSIFSVLQEHFVKLYEPSNFKLLFDKKTTDFLKLIIYRNKVDFRNIDKKGGISRSLRYLLSYVPAEDKEKILVINRDITITEIIKRILEQKKKDFTSYFYGAGATEDKPAYPGILSICNKKDFSTFCINVGYVDNNNKVSSEKLYKYIAPYLNYLCQENWDIQTLVEYILAIDAAIETDRIGMVNYS